MAQTCALGRDRIDNAQQSEDVAHFRWQRAVDVRYLAFCLTIWSLAGKMGNVPIPAAPLEENGLSCLPAPIAGP